LIAALITGLIAWSNKLFKHILIAYQININSVSGSSKWWDLTRRLIDIKSWSIAGFLI
jgi:hypothetical protein